MLQIAFVLFLWAADRELFSQSKGDLNKSLQTFMLGSYGPENLTRLTGNNNFSLEV